MAKNVSDFQNYLEVNNLENNILLKYYFKRKKIF